MVGYNDAYNRALTAKSNALQRRKGQMIDRLNGSGRGDEDSEDDYLSEDYEGQGMEGGAACCGGSFEEAVREVGSGATGGRMEGGFLPFLAAAAAPLVGSLVSKLFGGGYTGGARDIKNAMINDMMVSKVIDPALRRNQEFVRRFPELADIAMNVSASPELSKMRDMRFRPSPKMEAMGATGGRRRMKGGFLPMLAMAAAPMIGKAIGSLFGLGRTGAGATGGRMLVPQDNLPSGLGGARAERAQDFFDRDDERIGMEVRGLKDAERRNKEKNYALGAGGKRAYMRGGQANLAAMGQEALGGFDNSQQGKGLRPPRNVASRGYIEGGRRLKNPYGLGTPDAMEGEGFFDDVWSGIKNVGSRVAPVVGDLAGALIKSKFGKGRTGAGATGGQQMSPYDLAYGGNREVGGGATGGRAGGWIAHVKAYQAKHGGSYKDALKAASASYRR